MSEAGNWVRVASVADVAEGTAMAVETKGLSLAVYHLDGGEICVTDNTCTHAFALLTDGWLENGCIECPLHAAQFDVRNGKALSSPADEDLKVFQIKVEGDDLMLEV